MVKSGDYMRSKTRRSRVLAVLMLLSLISCGQKDETSTEVAPKLATSEPACLAKLKPKTEEERRKNCPPGFVPSEERKW
jgi:type IV pilus biogenesis protein CpaD/CtpE